MALSTLAAASCPVLKPCMPACVPKSTEPMLVAFRAPVEMVGVLSAFMPRPLATDSTLLRPPPSMRMPARPPALTFTRRNATACA